MVFSKVARIQYVRLRHFLPPIFSLLFPTRPEDLGSHPLQLGQQEDGVTISDPSPFLKAFLLAEWPPFRFPPPIPFDACVHYRFDLPALQSVS